MNEVHVLTAKFISRHDGYEYEELIGVFTTVAKAQAGAFSHFPRLDGWGSWDKYNRLTPKRFRFLGADLLYLQIEEVTLDGSSD